MDVGPQYLATRCCGYAAYGEANKTKKLIKGTNEDVRCYHLRLKVDYDGNDYHKYRLV